MELSIYTPSDQRLSQLQSELSGLDRELVEIQHTYNTIRNDRGKKCTRSLKEAVLDLLQVVNYVNKADKALVYWKETGKGTKFALRCIGIDKSTSAIIDKKSNKIKSRITRVQGKFERSGEVVMEGLKAVQELNTQVAHFSISSVGHAQREAAVLCAELDSRVQSVETSLGRTRTQCGTVQNEIDSIPSDIADVEAQRNTAQGASDSTARAGGAGLLIGGAAAVAGFFCPPAFFLAGAAGAFGVGSMVTSCVYDEQVTKLREKEANLRERLQSLSSEIESLESKVSVLNGERSYFTTAKNTASSLQDRCVGLRDDSQVILDELLEARMVLSRIRMKIKAIATELSDCGYAGKRRDIATQLRAIVEDVSSGNQIKIVKANEKHVTRLMGTLVQIEGRTTNVLMIMNAAGV